MSRDKRGGPAKHREATTSNQPVGTEPPTCAPKPTWVACPHCGARSTDAGRTPVRHSPACAVAVGVEAVALTDNQWFRVNHPELQRIRRVTAPEQLAVLVQHGWVPKGDVLVLRKPGRIVSRLSDDTHEVYRVFQLGGEY